MKPIHERLSDWIVAQRPERNPVSADRPYAYFTEPEYAGNARMVDVATVFLTNRECPFRCLMCDLWKNTLPTRIATGKIPEQIRWALARMPRGQHLKLYNSGNFFDAQAVPVANHPAIAELANGFERLIVECHPRLVGERCWQFQRLLTAELEVAMGLETVHPEVLPRLNKQMTLDDFARAVRRLHERGAAVRAFILVRSPFLGEEEGLEWTKRSIDYAFSLKVDCCSLIPMRSGNGAMEKLARLGHFSPPSLDELEQALEYGLSLGAGRVFLDLWDLDRVSPDAPLRAERLTRLARMNLTQCCNLPPVHNPS